VNAERPLLLSLLVTLLLFFTLLAVTSPLWASTSYLGSQNRSNPIAFGALHDSLFTAMHPRCELDLTGANFVAGDTVAASWRIRNPSPTRVDVEIKIWFTAPGHIPYSISSNLDSGKPVTLPAALDQDTGMTELFVVDDTTTRGIYEISCRLIDPITGGTYSEDLNDFQVN
jgi:hypothetical protein